MFQDLIHLLATHQCLDRLTVLPHPQVSDLPEEVEQAHHHQQVGEVQEGVDNN